MSSGQHVIAVDERSAAVEMAFVHEFRNPWVLVHSGGAATHYADFLVGHSTVYMHKQMFKMLIDLKQWY